MDYLATQPSHLPYQDVDGAPLEAGYLYFGVENLNPETNPITVYWDAACTQPAAQPIRTLAGFPVRNGKIAQVHTQVNYSQVVKNRNGVLVYATREGKNTVYGYVTRLISSIGSSLIGFIQAGVDAVVRTIQDKLRETISVKDFGAVGDFDPTTGTGTDDLVAIQAAFDYAMLIGNCKVVFPAGNYYLGTGTHPSAAPNTGIQLLLGSQTVANAANDIELDFQGTLYGSLVGARMLVIANANNINLNPKIIGYAGGALGANREYDWPLVIGYNSRKITLGNDYYISNFLGYVFVGGDLSVAGGGAADTPSGVTFGRGIIKMRYGNGVSSPAGGSRSQHAVQIVDAEAVTFTDECVVYGTINMEPNNIAPAHQRIVDVQVMATFRSGFVTPVVPGAVSTYWQDEVIGLWGGGGTEIGQGVYLQGLDTDPYIHGVTVGPCSFESGEIYLQGQSGTTRPSAYVGKIRGVSFYKGKIRLGVNSGTNVNNSFDIDGVQATQVTNALNGLVCYEGMVSGSTLKNISLLSGDLPAIGLSGAGVRGDAGTNTYSNIESKATTTYNWINVGAIPSSSRVFACRPNPVDGAPIKYNFSLAPGATKTVTVTVPAGYGVYTVSVGGNQSGANGYAYAQWLIAGDFGDSATPAYAFSTVVAPVANFRLSFSTITIAAGSFSFQAISAGGAGQAEIVVSLVGGLHNGAIPSIAAA